MLRRKPHDPAYVQWIESENERLEARVEELENENRILVAALDDMNPQDAGEALQRARKG